MFSISMMTFVSRRPRSRPLATRRRVLVKNGVYIGEESLRVDRWCVCKGLQNVGLRGKARASSRRHFGNRYAVSGNNKGFAGIKCAHDRAAFVAQFALSNLALHALSVAQVPHHVQGDTGLCRLGGSPRVAWSADEMPAVQRHTRVLPPLMMLVHTARSPT